MRMSVRVKEERQRNELRVVADQVSRQGLPQPLAKAEKHWRVLGSHGEWSPGAKAVAGIGRRVRVGQVEGGRGDGSTYCCK